MGRWPPVSTNIRAGFRPFTAPIAERLPQRRDFPVTEEKEVVVGLTGQTGAGKSTLTKFFADMGYAVIDADKVARTVAADPDVLLRLCAVFGDEILRPDGTLDRRLLAAKTFSDKEQLEKLNAVMNPPIIEKIEGRSGNYRGGGAKILLDAPNSL